LLALGPGVDAGIKERPEQSPVAEQNPQELVVIDIDVVEPGRVEQIVAVNENGDASAMPELPRRACGRIKLHFFTLKTVGFGRTRSGLSVCGTIGKRIEKVAKLLILFDICRQVSKKRVKKDILIFCRSLCFADRRRLRFSAGI
jgi:hypothetical protein